MIFDAKGNQTPSGQESGARKLGVENMAVHGVQGRAVMVDLEAHFGRSGKIVGYEDWIALERRYAGDASS